ncbi:MAG TPA: hypothetical protein QGF58_20485 [Myxococcota bacterium]|nr:hypothetical protein [Myxococcota bacterium]
MSLALLSLACFGVPGLGGQAGEELTDTATPDADSGNVEDSDTGEDSEANDELTAGTYGGMVMVDLYDGSEQIDSCSGSANVDIEDSGSLSGMASCDWDSGGEPLSLSIEGSTDGGTIFTVDSSWDWTGTVEDNTLVGTWEGVDNSGLDHVGRFEIDAD